MSVMVRDTLSGEPVDILRRGHVGIYVCGPTVYNDIHIGNARAPLFWDVVVRYLRSRGYRVTFVQNITDVEDKIINRANAEGVSWKEIVRRYTRSYHERLAALGVGLPDVEPRATEHVPEIISLIEALIGRGHAYAPGNGDVYYRVRSCPGYGRLSHQRPEEMRETEKGARGYKESPLDFALWKASKPGEPSWESPWGPGRPGWHIECSAMVLKHLPDGADVHGGGTDLRFPHHENELAQSKGAYPERTFVRAWAHHGMVNFAEDKMAKSVGNVVDVMEAVGRHGRNAIRMWLLQSHYSQPVEYAEEILLEKGRSFERLSRFYREIADSRDSSPLSESLAAELRERYHAAMADDLNTPEVLAALFDAARAAGREVAERRESATRFASLAEAMREIFDVFGFDLSEERTAEVDGITIRYAGGEPGEELLRMVAEREAARRERNWPVADGLREEIRGRGWALEDTPAGPVLNPLK